MTDNEVTTTSANALMEYESQITLDQVNKKIIDLIMARQLITETLSFAEYLNVLGIDLYFNPSTKLNDIWEVLLTREDTQHLVSEIDSWTTNYPNNAPDYVHIVHGYIKYNTPTVLDQIKVRWGKKATMMRPITKVSFVSQKAAQIELAFDILTSKD